MRITNHRQGKFSSKPVDKLKGRVPKHAFLDENYVLNTEIMFTKLEFEF